MTDKLRDRIAAAIADVDDWQGVTDPTTLADAVIRELGLEPQAHYDPDCDYYRYVTDWIDPRTHQRVDLS